MKLFITFFFCLSALGNFAGKIFDVKSKNEISDSSLTANLSNAQYIVIGEKHYTHSVQELEGKIIRDVVSFKRSISKTRFVLGWEFLNATDEKVTGKLFEELKTGRISTDEFLYKTQANPDAHVYAPMINEVIKLNGHVMGVNLSRQEKAPVVKNGLKALDPKLLPPDFKEGGELYFERFFDVMKDHATMDQIKNYFSAQSLVDDVSAFHLSKNNFDIKFLVIGAFHSMYNDGVVKRLKVRNPNSKVLNVEILDVNDFEAMDLEDILQDSKYGNRADYIIFTQ